MPQYLKSLYIGYILQISSLFLPIFLAKIIFCMHKFEEFYLNFRAHKRFGKNRQFLLYAPRVKWVIKNKSTRSSATEHSTVYIIYLFIFKVKWAIQHHWKRDNRDAVVQFGNRMSSRQYGKQRMALYFESKKEARQRYFAGIYKLSSRIGEFFS